MLNRIGEHSEEYMTPGGLCFLMKYRPELKLYRFHIPKGMFDPLQLFVGMAHFLFGEDFFWHGRFKDVFSIEPSGFFVGERIVFYLHCFFGDSYRVYLLHMVLFPCFPYFVIPALQFFFGENELGFAVLFFGYEKLLPVVGTFLFLQIITSLDSGKLGLELCLELSPRGPFFLFEFRIDAKHVSLVSVSDFHELFVKERQLDNLVVHKGLYLAVRESGNIFDALVARVLVFR